MYILYTVSQSLFTIFHTTIRTSISIINWIIIVVRGTYTEVNYHYWRSSSYGSCRHWRRQGLCLNCLRCRDRTRFDFPINHGFDLFHDRSRIFAKFNQSANTLDDIQPGWIVQLTIFAYLFQFDTPFRFIVGKGVCFERDSDWVPMSLFLISLTMHLFCHRFT